MTCAHTFMFAAKNKSPCKVSALGNTQNKKTQTKDSSFSPCRDLNFLKVSVEILPLITVVLAALNAYQLSNI